MTGPEAATTATDEYGNAVHPTRGCPRCLAHPGAPCRLRQGQRRRDLHAARTKPPKRPTPIIGHDPQTGLPLIAVERRGWQFVFPCTDCGGEHYHGNPYRDGRAVYESRCSHCLAQPFHDYFVVADAVEVKP